MTAQVPGCMEHVTITFRHRYLVGHNIKLVDAVPCQANLHTISIAIHSATEGWELESLSPYTNGIIPAKGCIAILPVHNRIGSLCDQTDHTAPDSALQPGLRCLFGGKVVLLSVTRSPNSVRFGKLCSRHELNPAARPWLAPVVRNLLQKPYRPAVCCFGSIHVRHPSKG